MHFFHHGPHFHHHGHGPHIPFPHFRNWLPNFNPNVFPHHLPHYFPPYIPEDNHYQPYSGNNNNNNVNYNKIEIKDKEKYIPKDDDYDYSELYDFGNLKKEEEVNQNKIKEEKESNSQENIIISSSINSEIKKESINQEDNLIKLEDIVRDSQINSSDFFLLKHSQKSDNNIKNNIDNSNISNDNKINDDNNNENIIDINNETDNNKENNNNNQIMIESNHEHPLNYIEQLNITCTICHQINKDKPGYKCEQCPLIICLNCAERIFYGNKKLSIHPHPLLLKYKNEWKCNICEIIFKNTSSFSCDNCGFNVCTFCLIP